MTPTSIATTQRRTGSPQRRKGDLVTMTAGKETGAALALPASGVGGQAVGLDGSLLVKSALDFALATLFLLLAAPLFLVIAALIKITSPGPVLFVQERVGRSGKVFPFYKFRTMKHGSDDSVHREFSRDFICGRKRGKANGNGARVYKLTRDPRVTAVGVFLRRTSLDELPQLFNVLRGEMSLVGPRPPVVYELEHYQDWHKRRLACKPGLTGLWQVSGRSSVPFDEMVLLDLYYIEHRSTLMDLRIMFKTLPVMMTGSGGY